MNWLYGIFPILDGLICLLNLGLHHSNLTLIYAKKLAKQRYLNLIKN
jgi:hypothetical protein